MQFLRKVWQIFRFPVTLVSLTTSSICLRLLPRPPVTYILPSIFPSVTCFKMQFLCNVWQIFRFPVTLVSLTTSSICLRLLPRPPVTYILPSIFPSVTCFKMQFLRKVWPIQLASLHFAVCTIFLSPLTHCNTSFHKIGPTDLLHPSAAPNFRIFQIFLIFFPK